jgi:ribosomal protein S17E
MDDRGGSMEGSPHPDEARASAALSPGFSPSAWSAAPKIFSYPQAGPADYPHLWSAFTLKLDITLLCNAPKPHIVLKDRHQKSTKEFPMTDMTVIQDKMKAIASAHADYTKSSFEANKAYMEKLATTKAPDQAMQITSDHMKSAYETFVAEATKIGDMYKDFFKSVFEMRKLPVVN